MFLKKIFIPVLLSLCGLIQPARGQQKIEDFYFSNYQEDGSKSWEVEGKEARVFDSHVEVRDMNATYYSRDRVVDIKADKGTLTKPEMDTRLEDNVRVKSDDGASLYTDSLNWTKGSNSISTEDEVLLENGDFTIAARGLESKNALNRVDFQKEVKVDVTPQGRDGKITIECEGPLEVDFTNGLAVFNNKVSVDSPQGRMLADKATVYFDTERKTIVRIVSEGDVKLIRDENVTFAEKAVYTEADKKLFLEGSPRLILFPQDENLRD